MANEIENVHVASILVDSRGGAPVVRKSVGVDESTVQRFAAGDYQFSILDELADAEVLCTCLTGEDQAGNTMHANCRRINNTDFGVNTWDAGVLADTVWAINIFRVRTGP